jgi:parallel beta-helix repeat protein
MRKTLRQLATRVAIVLSVCVAWAAPSAAAPVTFNFTGSVTQASFDPDDPFSGSIDFGTTFNGSYTFDAAATDAIAAAYGGSYAASGAPYGFTLNIGGHTFSIADYLSVNVTNSIGSDFYAALACAGGPSCVGDAIELYMQDVSGTAINSDALPLTPPLLSAFGIAGFGLNLLIDGNTVQVAGQLASLTCSAGCGGPVETVPEPATLLLVTPALAFLARRRIRIPRAPALLCLAMLTGFASSAFAVDGVVLIDQTRVLAGNVTPGDAPGFPVTISLPGSYKLSGNLTVPAGTDAIVIQSDNVSLDLNGFGIAGAESSADFAGITDQGTVHRAISIRNGVMSKLGINMVSDQVEVREMRISDAVDAITLGGSAAVVTGNNLFKNVIGIRVSGSDGLISNNIASFNAAGIFAFTKALVSGNATNFNTFFGINAFCPSHMIGNQASNNGIDSRFNIDVTPNSGCTTVNNNPEP